MIIDRVRHGFFEITVAVEITASKRQADTRRAGRAIRSSLEAKKYWEGDVCGSMARN
jgi:hypothetical protein